MSAERADRIRAMREQGLTLREICEALNIAKSAVNRALYPRVRAYEADYSRSRYYTATCERCGRPRTQNPYDKRPRLDRLCWRCYRQRPAEFLQGNES